ncbi:MFS transporter [Sphaerisporangium fuscum]|uniref:MFS transporter n=1 Tax=Sphaerisporangium fuscum TaxID=2835868 RepID=UPI001BDC96CE|nr:MFS transporter [Sphaerisporangium fuscum]
MRKPGGLGIYLATAFLARLADEGVSVAVVMLALTRTGGAAQGAFVMTAWMAPHVLAAPLTGALVARMRRPRLFYAGVLAVFAAAVAALALLVGRVPLPVTLLAALAGGACGPVVTGGMSSLVARLAPAGPGRDRAYALDAAVYNAASVAGPAVVGVMAGLASPDAATVLLAGTAACAAALVTMLPYQDAAAGDDTSPATVRAGLVAGLAALWRVRELRAITSATTLAFVGVGALTTTTVLLAASLGSPGTGSVLITTFAVGALAGSLVMARWPRPVPAQRLAGAGLTGTGLALAAAALVPSAAACVPLFALAGLFDGPLLSATLRIRADHAPAAARAQVFTLGAGLKVSAAACGAALVGVGAALPPALLLLGIAALQLAAAFLYQIVRFRGDQGRRREMSGVGSRS